MHTKNGIENGQPFGRILDEFFNKSISDIADTNYTHETPSVNILETEDAFELEVAAPGLSREDFKVVVEHKHLIVSADFKTDESKDEVSFKRKEYNFNKFSRKFTLPETVDKESVKAKYDLGILRITVDKTPEAKNKGPRSIEID